jgi:hypothetical protein
MATRAEKDAEHRFRECIREERKHLRVGKGRRDDTEVRLVGSASELHGPDGLCTCCKRGSG